jgi:hypothetical protein
MVLAVLDEAVAWLAARGVAQWPAAFRPEWIEPALDVRGVAGRAGRGTGLHADAAVDRPAVARRRVR